VSGYRSTRGAPSWNRRKCLLPHRRLEDFRGRVPPRIATTTVAATENGLLGFVTVHDAEVEGGRLPVPSRRYEKSLRPAS